ncbi:MAG: peptidoglycan DD-metalloendopeptidase family protein [Flavobacterium sp.]|nr:peptidoglycan DD-metalloendopeptidase family protein [Flavobacterium sp.]
MKLLSLILFSSLILLSCGEEEKVSPDVPVVKPDPIIVEFGFTLNDYDVLRDTIVSGETFGTILQKQNIGDLKVHEIVQKISDTFNIRKIQAGKPYTILRGKDSEKKVKAFIYQPDRLNYFVVDFRDSIAVSKKTKPVTYKRRTIAGALDGSLSAALEKQRIDPSLATRISNVYAWSIDFFKLQKGDKFALTFTERFINDSVYDGVETIEAAFFEYKGEIIYAFPFVQDESNGRVEYFDHEGKVLKNMFLKAPLKFSRISSRFSPRRFHPVQQVWKAHKGTDYAAPHGTPIMTTAAGVVEQTGFTAGNGNYVKVRHNSTYSTQYLHMSKILVRRGQRVAQGDVIGKVGSTGLATGPHVCYRFWKNGVQVDALRLKLPNSEPMDPKHKPRFIAYMTPLKAELDSIANINFNN